MGQRHRKKKTHKQAQGSQNFQDGLVSLTNNLANRRNVQTNNAVLNLKISQEQNNEIYKSGIGNKIVGIKVNTSFKEGLTFKSTMDEAYYNKHLAKKVREAAMWQLAFGRGILVIIEKDRKLSDPLSQDLNLNRVLYKVFDGSMVTAHSVDRNLKSERYYMPTTYQVRGESIHYSRVIDFTYVPVREDDKPTYQYAGMSEFELIYEQIVNDGVVERAAPAVLEKSAQKIYKVKGFKQALQNKKEGAMLEYFGRLEDLASVYGASVMDSEDAVEQLTVALSGLSDTDQITLRRLALVTGIPLAVLIGESVKGLGANGDNEMTTFFMMVQSLQENYFIEHINDLLERIDKGQAEFKQPEQQTPQEKAVREGTILDNAMKLAGLGKDVDSYLKENGIKTDSNFDIFSDEAFDDEDE